MDILSTLQKQLNVTYISDLKNVLIKRDAVLAILDVQDLYELRELEYGLNYILESDAHYETLTDLIKFIRQMYCR